MDRMSRKAFLGLGLVSAIAPIPSLSRLTRRAASDDPAPTFPQQQPEIVQEIVTVAHSDLDRVRKLVTARPALAKASFGDLMTTEL
jgi:hypothetical protein